MLTKARLRGPLCFLAPIESAQERTGAFVFGPAKKVPVMKITKVALFGNIPSGTQVWLTPQQAGSRSHALAEVETDKTRKDRKLYVTNQQLGFKAGEELAIEGDLDRGLEAMFGIAPSDAAEGAGTKSPPANRDTQLDAAFARGKAAGRKEMLDEVSAHDAAHAKFEAAQDDLDALAEGADRTAAEAAVTAAKAAVDALPELKA